MKLVIQRVKSAKVTCSGNTVGQIDKGLFILLGVGQQDKEEDVERVAEKIVNMRIMSDNKDKMNLSIKDVNGEVLVVSQFTLYADTNYGRRPSFVKAAPPELAKKIYEKLIESIKTHGLKVAKGNFGNYMEIESVTDGPVTIILDR